ncbi:MAG: DEAD/DEAH box helicase [Clostridia bacterium]|nr:DEAD/DEAH box helicase [Clostridia bacterium]
MTEADRILSRFPPFIREYVYRSGWQELRRVQIDAARIILDTRDNLLLTSSTASGKTEAAFFPILADLHHSPPSAEGISVLYIAPLKSLINDQFERLEGLLEESMIPVFHWHGDVSSSQKSKLLRSPSGILQITPESLESMLINRKNDIPRLFGALSYVVIDEVHALIGSDRGSQVICQLCRLGALLGHHPRRVGLSATVGDLAATAAWLGAGSGRETAAPPPAEEKLSWRLGMEHFYIGKEEKEEGEEERPRAALDAGYEYLYDAVTPCRSLVFSNSREETEYVTATLRQIAKRRGEKDIFYIHHGNLSASLREDAERRIKDEAERSVVAATVTMELGIDVGRLERVAQIDAPTTVSGFLQRLGRSGRRGAPPEMLMLFREEQPLPATPLPQLIPWGLLRGIAIVELYRTERFIEPPTVRTMPLSLAFQQTLSILASSGELTPRALAERLLSLPAFSSLSPEDYRELLVSMVEGGHIELCEEGTCIVGLTGERLTQSFKFYAVFADSEDFTVRAGSDEIGTITTPPPVGDRFALAGRVWEVEEIDHSHRLVFVHGVEGKMEISWPGSTGEICTRILEKMRDILFGEETYPYLMPAAARRLELCRRTAIAAGMPRSPLVSLGGQSYALFPWLGTRGFRATRRLLSHFASALGLSEIRGEGCCYLTFKARREDGDRLLSSLSELLRHSPITPLELVGEGEAPCFEKYDEYIPAPLLRRAYAADRLNLDEVLARFG